jgi:hypothetical protein
MEKNRHGCEKVYAFSLRDADRDAGGRATHGADAGKAGMEAYKQGDVVCNLIPSPRPSP